MHSKIDQDLRNYRDRDAEKCRMKSQLRIASTDMWLCCLQGCVYGAFILQGADQGVCLLPGPDHDSWRCFSQYFVHARGGSL